MSKPYQSVGNNIRRIPREDVERKTDEVRRAEIGMLKILMERYRQEAERFRLEMFKKVA
jgi:hypothetical protein